MKLIELIAGQAADSSREIEMDLKFSKIYDLVVKYEGGGLTSSNAEVPMKSGTTKTINLHVLISEILTMPLQKQALQYQDALN